jgi:hypothetical protein
LSSRNLGLAEAFGPQQLAFFGAPVVQQTAAGDHHARLVFHRQWRDGEQLSGAGPG